MKGLVVYDSVYGNTKQVAEAIGELIRAEGHEAQVVSVREVKPNVAVADFLFIGSPTRMGKPTRKTRGFVKKLNRDAWGNKPIASFDTYVASKPGDEKSRKWTDLGAGYMIHDSLKERGFAVRSPPLKCLVTGMRGPLAPDALEKAKSYVHEFLASFKA